MRRATILTLGLWLTGCPQGSTDDTDTDTTTPTETADTGDTDTTDTDTDTTPTGDTGTPTEPTSDLTFDLQGAWPGTAINLTRFDPESGAILDELASESVTSALHTMAVPDPDGLVSLDKDDPNVRGAIYTAAAFADDDSDGVHDPGELYVGLAPPLLLFLEVDGAFPIDLAGLGLVEGWNALLVDDKSLEVLPIDDIPLPLPEASSATVRGTYDEKAELRLATFPITAFGQKSWPAALVDDALGATWEITVTDEPPLDHQITGSPYFPDGSAVVLVGGYIDNDDDDTLTLADTIAYTACTPEGDQVSLTWLPQSDDLQVTVFLGGTWGWLVTLTEDDFIVLPSPAEGLVIGPCDPPKKP
ncbi:MAG: hypothetical protein KTR31_28765 [Myxococcales bacterium]|nr:hypothetical protein [Myxococcales bacterium]